VAIHELRDDRTKLRLEQGVTLHDDAHYQINTGPVVVVSLNNLAGIYQALGRSAEAEPLFKRSLAIWKKRSVPIIILARKDCPA
jgi:hypothetical protein